MWWCVYNPCIPMTRVDVLVIPIFITLLPTSPIHTPGSTWVPPNVIFLHNWIDTQCLLPLSVHQSESSHLVLTLFTKSYPSNSFVFVFKDSFQLAYLCLMTLWNEAFKMMLLDCEVYCAENKTKTWNAFRKFSPIVLRISHRQGPPSCGHKSFTVSSKESFTHVSSQYIQISVFLILTLRAFVQPLRYTLIYWWCYC